MCPLRDEQWDRRLGLGERGRIFQYESFFELTLNYGCYASSVDYGLTDFTGSNGSHEVGRMAHPQATVEIGLLCAHRTACPACASNRRALLSRLSLKRAAGNEMPDRIPSTSVALLV